MDSPQRWNLYEDCNLTLHDTLALHSEIDNIITCNQADEYNNTEFRNYKLGMGITNGILSLGGLIGNLLIAFTNWPTRAENATSFLLLALAGSDSTQLFFAFLTHYLGFLLKTFGLQECYYVHYIRPYTRVYLAPIDNIAYLVNSWMMPMLTLHRYIAVCAPQSVKTWGSLKAAKVQVILVVLGAVVFYIPYFFHAKVHSETLDFNITLPSGKRCVGYVWVYERKNEVWRCDPTYIWIYNVALYIIMAFVIPLCSLCYMTFRIVRMLRRIGKKRLDMKKSNRGEAEVTKAVVVVAAIFIICQVTGPLRRIFDAMHMERHKVDHVERCLGQSQQNVKHFNKYYQHIFYLMVAINGGIHFFIYCLLIEKFRNTFIERALACCPRKHDKTEVQKVVHHI